MYKRLTTILCTLMLVMTMGAGCGKTPAAQALEHITMGEKYLLELNYEQAVVSFLQAIDIDPMNPQGYAGAAEAYVALGDTDAAVAILEAGVRATGDAGLSARLAELEAALATPAPTEPTDETDYIVEWVDPAFEQMLRVALNKPEEDIWRSKLDGVKWLFITGVFPSINQQRTTTYGHSYGRNYYIFADDPNTEHTEIGEITVLDDLCHFVNLQHISITFNKIADISALSTLSIHSFDFYANNISDLTPLRNLTSLQHISLSQNIISDLSSLCNLTSLENISLGANNISDITPLGNLTSLQTLALNANNISDLSPLHNLTSLRTLALDGNNISDLSSLHNLTSLQFLGLGENNISDLSPINNLSALNVLHLHDNNVSDIAPLQSLVSLERISLYRNPLTDWSPVAHVKDVNGRPD